eukprot:Gregarina_sp_Poly_1__5171@NODE_273_length_10223_cov_99_622391_g238_i0_p3_GENE_NODE_273_length_10223_cov_99_622391_g238_i0NODE_273_length_10223_cov_99_622391_g238_i0_p3_ORF_typecomplete_len340_score53_85SPC25/PF06703_11/5_8e10_NODE_273_length_10223_cov_99_622391_g238_i0341053
MRQRKAQLDSKTQKLESLNEDLKGTLTLLDTATFAPYVEPIKCTSLYSETQLQKTCAEAISESLNGWTDDSNTPLLRELHHQSNVALLLGAFQVVTGASCCLLPFKRTSHVVIILLALNFFIGALLTLFFEWFVCDGVIMTADDTRLAGAKHAAQNGLTVICHFDKKRKMLRLAIAPAIRFRDAINLASRKAGKLLKTFHLFLYHILWRVQTSGLAIAAQQKDESLRLAFVSPTAIKDDDDGGCWEWVDTPGSIPIDQQFGCFSDVVKFSHSDSAPGTPKMEGKSPTEDKSNIKGGGHSGLILERPITRYFDEKGGLLADPLNKDLKSLFVKYYMARIA